MESDESDGDTLSTRDAFELVGNETRAEILRVLSEARDGGLPPALSFSELRERIGTEPRSSQFNYHLDRLVGAFLEDRSAESAQPVEAFVTADEGYALRPTGTFLTRLVTATSTPSAAESERIEPFDAAFDCHFCASTVRADYRNTTFRLQCPGCEHLYAYTLTPPGVVAGDPGEAELLDRASAYLRRKYTTFARGSCPLCANGVAPEVVSPEAINWPGSERLEALVRRVCDHCGNTNYALVGTELLDDAELVAFCRRHGLDVSGRRLWEVPFALTDRHTDVVDDDPWRAVLSVTLENATLRLRVDDELTVVERTRE
jgi:DNA-binding transcriptional ArsR family regulator